KKRFQKALNDFAKERYDYDQSKDDNKKWADQSTTEAGDEMKRLLEKAQYDLNNSIIDVELSQLALEYSYLYTPIEGVVTRVDSRYAGVNITPAQAEFEIINPKTLYFSFTADQTEVTQLKKGMQGKIVFDSFPDEEVNGEVSYISFTPKSGETGTVYEGRINLSEDDWEKYKYGMTGDVSFVLSEKKNVLVLPAKYLRTDEQGKYVEKKQGGGKIKKYIKLGIDVDGDYEVTSGLVEGDEIFLPPSQ
ncbi:MAG: HlyD family efflux transporter periplasmic adaptor subunit, partial [Candidatus Methanofastidiosa archaeon]|nr:HlyD family efflux transporter periplasmic adaptor subunit [Candidatus Methanofastidiosa archaeon]